MKADPPAIRLIKLKVRADSREECVRRRADDSFEIDVRAPAARGRANAAALAALGWAIGIPSKRLRIIKGATSPAKIVQVYI